MFFLILAVVKFDKLFFRRILGKPVPYPKEIDETSRSFIGGLLTKDPIHRLGRRGATEIKMHKFFEGIDWDLVAQKKVKPPIKPKIMNQVCFFLLK